jgi:hypothetical protein
MEIAAWQAFRANKPLIFDFASFEEQWNIRT